MFVKLIDNGRIFGHKMVYIVKKSICAIWWLCNDAGARFNQGYRIYSSAILIMRPKVSGIFTPHMKASAFLKFHYHHHHYCNHSWFGRSIFCKHCRRFFISLFGDGMESCCLIKVQNLFTTCSDNFLVAILQWSNACSRWSECILHHRSVWHVNLNGYIKQWAFRFDCLDTFR